MSRRVGKLPLIHEGRCEGDFTLSFGCADTDYFAFSHKSCETKNNFGACTIYAVLIDNSGRVIFNIRCEDCGKVDALKTHTYLFAPSLVSKGSAHTVESIYLSPKLQERIGKHAWDDL